MRAQTRGVCVWGEKEISLSLALSCAPSRGSLEAGRPTSHSRLAAAAALEEEEEEEEGREER